MNGTEIETKEFEEPTEDGKIVISFTPKEGATFAAGTYTLEIVDVTLPAGYTQSGEKKTITVTTGTGGKESNSGCDAGFGLFGLLAATGAVTLLRRKG